MTGLDTMANEHLFANGQILTKLRKSDRPIVMHGIEKEAGGTLINMGGDSAFGEVYYSHRASGNVYSFARLVQAGYEVVYDPREDAFTVVCKERGTILPRNLSDGLRMASFNDVKNIIKNQIPPLKSQKLRIRMVRADLESGSVVIKGMLQNQSILVNVTTVTEAVPVKERAIRTLKEIARFVIHDLQVKLPTALTPRLVRYAPHRDSLVEGKTWLLDAHSARERMTGRMPSRKTDFALAFGDYLITKSASSNQGSNSGNRGYFNVSSRQRRKSMGLFYNVATCKLMMPQKWCALPNQKGVIG
ncbi:hypothetical protein FVE85_9441 [Porphyridium purpureum]|uniref:Uncharacterized protein n=1 Tax=Porphyridium purpureum TaxID=35688 RepID=A0A5J4YI54_PORPP|nr:hypothetical protein FVE85_9441 [Porphyridium purpureum]|eukprot:POR4748..scf261_15